MNNTDTDIEPVYRCGCGEAMGEMCEATAPATEAATWPLIEWMPECHRASHAAARNSGAWPHNGAARFVAHPECAARLTEDDTAPDGCTWVEDLGPVGAKRLPRYATALEDE